MLSNAAWNAFLKTLEEPPPHVKFIFATTEVHKVPVTILSRCQRYDFKLIGAQAIATRLRFVLDKEGILADDAAISILAREAAGSMRDAMSLLDQVIGTGSASRANRLTAEGVGKVLGVASRVVLYRLSEAVITGDAAASVRIVGELAQQGYDLPHVARDFLAHLRDLVVTKVTEDAGSLLDLAEDEVADVRALAARSDTDRFTRLHQGFSRAFDDIVRSGQPRASLEMALVRLSRRPPLLPIDEVLRRLGALERRLAGGAPPPNASGAPTTPGGRGGPPGAGSPGGPRRPGGATTHGGTTTVLPQAPADAPTGADPTGRSPANGTNGTGSRGPHAIASAASLRTAPTDPNPPTPARTILASPRDPSSHRSPDNPSPSSAEAEPPAPVPTPLQAPQVAQASKAADGAAEGSLPGERPVDLAGWRRVLDEIRGKRPALASVFEHAALLTFGKARVTLGFEVNSFLAGQATDMSAKELLAAALAAHFGERTEVYFETIASKLPAVTLAAVDTNERRLRLDALRKAVATHPLVTAAIEVLSAELKDVRLVDAEA